MARHPIVAEDCERALAQSATLWPQLDGSRIFVTGGSGFFGTWFLELLTSAIDQAGITCDVLVLTRDPERYRRSAAAHIASHRCVTLVGGDICAFKFPDGAVDYVAHFGSTGPKAWHDSNPVEFFDMVIGGTRRVLDFCTHSRARRLLLASTGAIYGPSQGAPVAEICHGGPDCTSPYSTNAEAKRAAELLAVSYAKVHPGLETVIARGFAFIGPYLPEHAGFAAYEFIQDALAGRPIAIKGNGAPMRSYLYGSDLGVWLWTLLLKAPANQAWNVGSEVPLSIRSLAERVSAMFNPRTEIRVAGGGNVGAASDWYVPDTSKAKKQLSLYESIGLDEAIRRTAVWYRDNGVAPTAKIAI